MTDCRWWSTSHLLRSGEFSFFQGRYWRLYDDPHMRGSAWRNSGSGVTRRDRIGSWCLGKEATRSCPQRCMLGRARFKYQAGNTGQETPRPDSRRCKLRKRLAKNGHLNCEPRQCQTECCNHRRRGWPNSGFLENNADSPLDGVMANTEEV